MRADIVKCADFPIFAARNNRGDRKDVDGLGEPVSGRRDFLDADHIEPTAAEHFLLTFEALCGRIDMDGNAPRFHHLRIGFARAVADIDRKSTRLNSSHSCASRMPSSAYTTTQVTTEYI